MSKTLKQRTVNKSIFRILVLISICFHSFSQENTPHHLGTTFEYTPQDFRLSLAYEHFQKHLFQQVLFGIAVRKTIFQQNFNPNLDYGLGWKWEVRKFHFLPYFRTGYAIEQLRSTDKHRIIQQFEIEASGRIGYGIKNQFFLASGFGPAWELKYDHYTNKQATFFFLTYFFQLGYVHRF